MRKRIGGLEIDTIAAERSKFTAPLVLIHGLWCTSSVWHRLMGYLAHRGWDCHAVNLRGRGHDRNGNASIAEHLGDVIAVLRSFDAAPVIVGHDLGGMLALSAALDSARAIVAVSPLLPAAQRDLPLPAMRSLRTRIALHFRDELPPPRGVDRVAYFGDEPPSAIVPESGALARDLQDAGLAFPLGPTVPTLIVSGDADAVTRFETLRQLADTIGAEVQRVPGGGHALPWDRGWQERVAEIHRWLVRTLGDPLLALLDEEE